MRAPDSSTPYFVLIMNTVNFLWLCVARNSSIHINRPMMCDKILIEERILLIMLLWTQSIVQFCLWCVCVCIHTYVVPLSAASSMIMDTAIHGLLSESIGSLTMSPTRKCQTLKTTKTSQSATVPPYVSV